jgi:hypothetical protein
MNYTQLIPLISQLLSLGLKIADVIEQSEDLNPEDKAALKEAIDKAKASVTSW